MSYSIKTIKSFDKEFKRLSKRYRSLKEDLINLIDELQKAPYQGADLGNHIHKVRMSVASKGKGKSHGARIITSTAAIFSMEEGEITLLYIYDKAEQSTLSDEFIKQLVEESKPSE
ncbi:MAG: type II toxin-antitoxin system RelE/ParE family toxin [Bacteroides sp.]|nr:type II toxin-antitoxin system RelE/ParE family toxin [Bacteroides sp.]